MTNDKVKAAFQFYLANLNEMSDEETKQMSEEDTLSFSPDLPCEVMIGHLKFVCEEGQRLVNAGRTEKAMRWLGFIQGVMWVDGKFTLDQLKNHSRPAQEETT